MRYAESSMARTPTPRSYFGFFITRPKGNDCLESFRLDQVRQIVAYSRDDEIGTGGKSFVERYVMVDISDQARSHSDVDGRADGSISPLWRHSHWMYC